MLLPHATEGELYEAGSLKWTGVTTEAGLPTIGAWVAEMDYGTSPAVQDRLIRAVKDGFLGYLPRWAGPEVTEAFVRLSERRYGWVVQPEWVSLSRTVLTALRATIEHMTRPGSQVIVPTPSYMPFLTIPGTFDRDVIEVPSLHDPKAETAEEAWSLDLDGIRAGLEAGAGLVVLCNPWNPTGRVLSVAELRALHDVVKDYDALVFADEVWSPLVLDDPASFVSYASLGPTFAEHTITAQSASKAWNIAGLNCAQVILPDADLRARWEEEALQACSGVIGLGAVGAIAAYTDSDDWLAAVITQINQNLDTLEEAIAGTKVDYFRPQGTYVAWLGFDDYELGGLPVDILREQHRVAVNDGVTLGEPYANWIRVNAAASPEPWQLVVAAIQDLAHS